MPTIILNKEVIEKLVGKKLPVDKLKDRIIMLGTDLEKIEGNEIHVEIFPNRPDLLSEQGFARALASFIGVKTGLKKYDVKKTGHEVIVKGLPKEWPYAVTAIVKGLKFDDEKIREIIQVQEKLGVTLLRNRKKGGIGIYPLEKITLPITFTAEDPDKISFVPLEYPGELSGRQILSKHPTGREYGHICEGWKKFPIFKDAKGVIMSMPPIINSHDVGKITENTKDVFVEATGTDLNTLKVALNIVVTTMADMGGQIYSFDVKYSDGTKITTPDLNPSKMDVDIDYISKRIGVDLKESDAKKLLERMGYGYEKGKALIPAYRADVLHPVDLAEDICIAYGYENIKPEIPKVATIAEENDFWKFKEKIANMLVGLKLLEVKTYHLTSKENQTSKMESKSDVIALANASTKEYNVLRSWIIPNLMDVLQNNKHNEYPQNIFDIGTIFKKSAKTDTGVGEAVRVAVALCNDKTDFTEIKQVLDYIMRMIGVKYEINETECSSFIPGRCGIVSLNGKDIAYIGEISPKVLSNWELQVPVAALEINLTDLFEAM